SEPPPRTQQRANAPRSPGEGEERSGEHRPGLLARGFARWQAGIDAAIAWYTRRLDWVMNHRLLTVLTALVLLIVMVVGLGPFLRREYFPEVDADAFEMYVRAPSGTRIERTEERIAEVEKVVQQTIGDDLELVISETGVWADWSSAYTPNSGPMDTVMRVQLKKEREGSSQDYAQKLRTQLAQDKRFAELEFSFNTGGTIRGALNEGQATPINIRIEGKHVQKSRKVAENLLREVKKINGVVDARILQRLDYPEYTIEVNRAKARELGLSQEDIMKSVISALNSSIQFNKKNFWIDPKSKNQYFVGVQYHETDIKSLETVLNVSITSPMQKQPIPLSNFVKLTAGSIASEVTHDNLQTAIDLQMDVHGRDLGHVASDITRVVDQFGQAQKKSSWSLSESGKGEATWIPYEPDDPSQKKPLAATTLKLSGEYGHMNDSFYHFAIGLTLAVIFVYFLMVTLLDSYLIPLVILSAVPVGLVGVIPMLFLTGTAINVQSLLGVIFMVGIVVSNTVLLTDFAEVTRKEDRSNPTEAIVKA